MTTTRRQLLTQTGATLAAGLSATLISQPVVAAPRSESEPFGYSLNMSTIRGQNLTLPQQVEVAAKAGYQAIEPWIRDIDQFVKDGGSLKDVSKQIRDLGLSVQSAIGFAEWIVDDDVRRVKGFEEARRSMDLVAQLGGVRLAAPPVGATKQTDLNLFKAAERYRKLLELGDQVGVVPEVEVWGHSTSLGRLGESVFVAIESQHPKACLLPDIYHLYKGGSDFAGLRMLSGNAIQVFHVNDYPATPPRSEIKDADRVYPGDGVAPLAQIFRDLRNAGFRGWLSLELFNPEYWKQDALMVARTGLEKTRAAVQAALA